MSIKLRTDPSANYRAVFVDGRTIRTALDPKKPITELAFPEFYDVSFGTKCHGNCIRECYAAAIADGVHYKNLAQKIHNFFGQMTDNQRPTQVACGGGADSMENPECWEALQAFNDLGIVPNLTTHSMLVNEKTVPKIVKHCGGIAVSLHPHLEKFWRKAIDLLCEAKVRLNLHVVISDKESIDLFVRCYREFAERIEYFVLLRRMNVGHAAKFPRQIDYPEMTKAVDSVHKEGKLAFGANFYPWLKQNKAKYGVSIYPPEIFSKYLLLTDDMELFNNSFEMKRVPYTIGVGCELGHARGEFNET